MQDFLLYDDYCRTDSGRIKNLLQLKNFHEKLNTRLISMGSKHIVVVVHNIVFVVVVIVVYDVVVVIDPRNLLLKIC